MSKCDWCSPLGFRVRPCVLSNEHWVTYLVYLFFCNTKPYGHQWREMWLVYTCIALWRAIHDWYFFTKQCRHCWQSFRRQYWNFLNIFFFFYRWMSFLNGNNIRAHGCSAAPIHLNMNGGSTTTETDRGINVWNCMKQVLRVSHVNAPTWLPLQLRGGDGKNAIQPSIFTNIDYRYKLSFTQLCQKEAIFFREKKKT